MWKRIFGAILFVWMAGAVIGSANDMLSHQGVRGAMGIASMVAFTAMALIGLVTAITPAKRLPPDNKNSDQNTPPASP